MRRMVAGLDVGATKVRVMADDSESGARLLDVVLPNPGWVARSDPDRAQVLVALAERTLVPAGEVASVVAGVHGSDSPSQQNLLRAALLDRFGVADVVNDSELVLPAHGLTHGTGLIAGTGSSATSRLPGGGHFTVGGWGWLLGDEGGAVGIVREAAREVLASTDRQEDDPLVPVLLDALGAAHPHALGYTLATVEPMVWAGVAPVVFAAAEQGSPRAQGVLRRQALALADLLAVVGYRGGDLTTVVAAGGVMTNQAGFFEAFVAAAHETVGSQTRIVLLTRPPAEGAVALARRLADHLTHSG